MDRKVNDLTTECRIFSRYLVNREVNDYIVEKYCNAHYTGYLSKTEWDYFNTLLLKLATIAPFLTTLVDTYSAVLMRNSLVRRKLVLLLAIMESSGAAALDIEMEEQVSVAKAYVKIFKEMVFFFGTVIIAVVIVLPLHLLFKIVSRVQGKF